jgi:hypothetical protein
MKHLREVEAIVKPITCECLGKKFKVLVEHDKKFKNTHWPVGEPRVYIQLSYRAKCTKTGHEDFWKGRKWYLSEHMTADEIVKTVYAAFEAAVKHEIMEGFKYYNKIVFNPHVDFVELLKITNNEVKRQQPKQLKKQIA